MPGCNTAAAALKPAWMLLPFVVLNWILRLVIQFSIDVRSVPRKAMTVVSDPGSLSRTALPLLAESSTTRTCDGRIMKYSHAARKPETELSMPAQFHASIALASSTYAIFIASCSNKLAASSFQCVSSMCDRRQLSAFDVSGVKLFTQDPPPADPHQLLHQDQPQLSPSLLVQWPAPSPHIGYCPGQVQGGGAGAGGGEGGGGGAGGAGATLKVTGLVPAP